MSTTNRPVTPARWSRLLRRVLFPPGKRIPRHPEATGEGLLLLLAVFMVLAVWWQTEVYRYVPDNAGRTFETCAVQFAGFAWFC